MKKKNMQRINNKVDNNLCNQLSRLAERPGTEFRSPSSQCNGFFLIPGWPPHSLQVYCRFSKLSILKYLWSMWERGMLAIIWKTKISVP